MPDSWYDAFQAAKAHADLRDILQRRGQRLQGDKLTAPWRDERTPSVHVYRDHWVDYGDQEQRGDLLDWLERGEGYTSEDARVEASRILGITDPDHWQPTVRQGGWSDAPRPSQGGDGHVRKGALVAGMVTDAPEAGPAPHAARPGPSWLQDLVRQAHQALRAGQSGEAGRAHSHLEGRRLLDLVDVLQLGVIDDSVQIPQMGPELDRARGRLLIPTLQNGRPIGYTARDLRGDEPKYLRPTGSSAHPFNVDALEEAKHLGYLVLTEGELDAAAVLAAYGTGYPVLGLSGGNIPRDWLQAIADTKARVRILFDADQPGRQKAERAHALLTGAGIRAHIAHLRGPNGSEPPKDVNELLQQTGASTTSELLEILFEESEAEAISDLLYVRDTWLAELDARAQRPHAYYTTGLDPLDELLGGGYAEGLHILGGLTAGGKTSLALAIARHNALQGRSVVYATYEQSRLELWARLAANLTGVPYAAIKRGTYERAGQNVLVTGELKASEGWENLELAAKHLKIVEGGDALSRTETSYTIDVLANTAEAIAAERGAPPLIVVDYLQRMPAPREIRDVRERVGYAAGQLQVRLGRGIGCPVLALSSINRASYRLADLELEDRLASLKEAGEVEYTAYTAALLYGLPEAYQGMQMNPGVMDAFRPMVIDLVKHREGQLGRLAVKWTPPKDRWANAMSWKGGAL